MNLSLFIARRYLFSKKSHNIINIISAISTFTVAVVTAAMVIVISAFDGLEKTITDLYKAFDADIVVSAAEGKTFLPDSVFVKKIKQTGYADFVAYSLEESVLIRYGERQAIATIKGVTDNYPKVSGIDTMMTDGEYYLGNDTIAATVMGYGVARRLGVALNDVFTPISVYSAKRKYKGSIDVTEAFSTRAVYASAIFSVQNQPEYDDKYIVAPIVFVQDLLGRPDAISYAEIKLKPGIDITQARDGLQAALGPGFTVKNRYQLHEVLYKVINSEKWVLFLILSLILLIAIFNIMGSLTMLIIEKQNDSETLKALGADKKMLHSIFRTEGFLIAFIGTIAGVGIGLLLCFLQLQFSFILMAGEGSLPYPIHIRPLDIAAIALIVMFVGTVVGRITTSRAIS